MNNTYKDFNKDIDADLISVRQKLDNDLKDLNYNYIKLK